MRFVTFFLLVFGLCRLEPLVGQSAENVLLVLNETSQVSLEIGQYYAEKRGMPADNILRLSTGSADEIARAAYEREIEAPIAAWMARNSGHDRILYIVLTKGVPLRVTGTSGPRGNVASVDSELALLYRKMTGAGVPTDGWVGNPYFLGEAAPAQAKRFTHKDYDIFLVTRLDGYSGKDVRDLIDRGFAPAREGTVLLDAKGPASGKGDGWLHRAADLLRSMGFEDRVVLDGGERVLRDADGVLGYYSWGSNDPGIRTRRFGFRFVPGALAGMFVSSDARTFAEPPPDWQVGSWEGNSPRFAGSPQALAGDLIREGVTGIAGHVAEPYLEATIRPDILFPAYLGGFNLAEAYYLAMPYLSWQTVVVGDPLCAPFRQRSPDAQEIDPGIDPETELPRYFSPRRTRLMSVAALKLSGMPPEAIKALLRGEVRLAKGDKAGARRALEEATARDARLVAAQTYLALLYEEAGEHDKAVARYRAVVKMTPNNAVALNNLAYALAVRQNKPEAALPLAVKAHELAKASPNITDTLAWVYHLLGENGKAMELLTVAARDAPQNAEIQFHYAAVAAALGRYAEARAALARALELDPKLTEREEVAALRARLGQPD